MYCAFKLTWDGARYFNQPENSHALERLIAAHPQMGKSPEDDSVGFVSPKGSRLQESGTFIATLEYVVNLAPMACFDIEAKGGYTPESVAEAVDDRKFGEVITRLDLIEASIGQVLSSKIIAQSLVEKVPMVVNLNNDMLLRISEVTEVSTDDVSLINDRLGDGWVIVSVFTPFTTDEQHISPPTYVLGKPGVTSCFTKI